MNAKLVMLAILAMLFFSNGSSAGLLAESPLPQDIGASEVASIPSNPALSEYVELAKTDTFLTIEMVHASGRKTRHLVQEGAMAYIKIGNDAPARFIVSKNKDTQQFEFLPVVRSKWVMGEKSVSGLKILAALPWGKVHEDLKHLGIVSVELAAINDKTELETVKRQRFSGIDN